jgi:hypothetical protein
MLDQDLSAVKVICGMKVVNAATAEYEALKTTMNSSRGCLTWMTAILRRTMRTS